MGELVEVRLFSARLVEPTPPTADGRLAGVIEGDRSIRAGNVGADGPARRWVEAAEQSGVRE